MKIFVTGLDGCCFQKLKVVKDYIDKYHSKRGWGTLKPKNDCAREWDAKKDPTPWKIWKPQLIGFIRAYSCMPVEVRDRLVAKWLSGIRRYTCGQETIDVVTERMNFVGDMREWIVERR